MVSYLIKVYKSWEKDDADTIHKLANVVPNVATQIIIAEIPEVAREFFYQNDSFDPEVFLLLLDVVEENECVLLGYFERIFQSLINSHT